MKPIDSTEQIIRPHFLRRAWQLTKPYWRSEERWSAMGMLVAIIAMSIAMVGLAVYNSYWNRLMYNALQSFDASAFPPLALYYFLYLFAFIAIAILQYYVQSILQLRWRRWLTSSLSGKWISHGKYYQLELGVEYSDNPDQRISEDIDTYTDLTLSLFIGLISSLLTFFSFIGMLWSISGTLDFTIADTHYSFPHYMVWFALIYSLLGSWLAHLIGRKLVSINYYKQRVEANLRFGLVRLRENSRAISMMEGDAVERQQVSNKFQDIWYATRALIKYNKRLLGYNSGFSNVANIFPFFAAMPQYFSKQITLGNLSQISVAFGNVQSSLSWFASSYQDLTTWRAVIERLDNFSSALDALPDPTQREGQSYSCNDNAIPAISNMEVALPQGTPMLKIAHLTLNQHENTLIDAPSGTGKSLLYGVLAGQWPFWKGSVTMPTSAFFIPQTPYLPIGTLAEVLAYPAEVSRYSDTQLEEAINVVGLSHLKASLNDTAHWERRLSPGEQQRISFARALLRQPKWLFLDEATASLHLDAEQALYQLLVDRLPNTTIISIAHKNTLSHFHTRRVQLTGLREA